MARPSWVTAVGVLGIIFGCTGILGGGQQMLLPKMLAFQKEMFSDMKTDMDRARRNSNCHNDSAVSSSGSDSSAAGVTSGEGVASGEAGVPKRPCQAAPFPGPGFPAVFQDLWNFPPWFATWMEISGALRCLVGAFYLFSAIWFIQLKPSSIGLFSTALSLSIMLGVAQLFATFFTATFLLAAMMAGSSVGLVFDLVLLIVIWVSDRTAFRPLPAAIERSPATL